MVGLKSLFVSVASVGTMVLGLGCGAPKDAGQESQTSIIGGSRVSSSDPVVQSTVALVSPDGRQFCTGSLISARQVLTAAHCLDGYRHSKLYIAFGTVAKPGSFASERLRVASSMQMHAGYDEGAMEEEEASRPPNDIALVMMKSDAPEGYKPIPMLTQGSDLTDGEDLHLAGFGLTNYRSTSSGVLYKVTTKLTEQSSAAREIHFGETPGRSACMGDSGGPAFVVRDGRFFLTGVTSRGSARCDSTGIYTDVRYFRSWISQTAQQLR